MSRLKQLQNFDYQCMHSRLTSLLRVYEGLKDSQRVRRTSRRRSAAAPGDTRAARLDSGVRPAPAWSAEAAAAR